MIERLKSVGKSLKREVKVYRLVLKDGRTPRISKIMLGLAVGYTLFPFDLIPDTDSLSGCNAGINLERRGVEDMLFDRT